MDQKWLSPPSRCRKSASMTIRRGQIHKGNQTTHVESEGSRSTPMSSTLPASKTSEEMISVHVSTTVVMQTMIREDEGSLDPSSCSVFCFQRLQLPRGRPAGGWQEERPQ